VRTLLHTVHILLPVLMGPALAVALAAAWGLPWYSDGVAVLIAGAMTVYTGDRVVERGDQLRPPLRLALAIGGGAAAVLTAAVTLRHADRLLAPVVALGLLAVAYPALKRIPIAKALAVGGGWTVAIAVLPFVAEITPWYLLARPAVWAIFALVTAGTILCDFKDQLGDRVAAIPSLPVWWGERPARMVAIVLALYGMFLAGWTQAWGLWLPGFLLVVLASRVELLRRWLWGPIAVDAALCTAAVVGLAGL